MLRIRNELVVVARGSYIQLSLLDFETVLLLYSLVFIDELLTSGDRELGVAHLLLLLLNILA